MADLSPVVSVRLDVHVVTLRNVRGGAGHPRRDCTNAHAQAIGVRGHRPCRARCLMLAPSRKAYTVAMRLCTGAAKRAFWTESIASFTRSDTKDGTIVFRPATGCASASVILLHGLGDTAEGLTDVAEMWARQLPHCSIHLPTAPTRPVTINGGYLMPSWYDLVGHQDRLQVAFQRFALHTSMPARP